MAASIAGIDAFRQVAETAARRYPYDGAVVRPLAVSENATFLVCDPASGARRAVLRVGRPGYHTLPEYQSEVALLRHLGDHTPLVVPRPLPARDGGYVQQVELDGTTYFCTATEFLAGVTLEHDDGPEAAPGHFRTLGEVAARLHRHVDAWDGARNVRRFRWDCDGMIGTHAVWGDWRDHPGLTAACKAEISRCCGVIRRRLARYGRVGRAWGVIHADLRDANVIVEGNVVKLIDFDDFGVGWRLHDLASSLTFIEDREDAPALADAYLDGYRRVAPLSDADLAEVDTFVLQRRIQILAWMGSHRDSPTARAHSQGYLEGTMLLVDRYLSLFG